MGKIFDWLTGSFFRSIGRILAYIFIGYILFLIFDKLDIHLFMSVSAATLNPKSVYSGNKIVGDYNSWGNNNTYSFSTSPVSSQGAYYWENVATGTSVSGKAYAIAMGFQYNLTAQKYYDITINFRDRDLRSVVNTSSIDLTTGASSSTLYDENISLIGVTNSATTSSNTNKLIVRVYVLQPVTYWVINIYGENQNITSVNNFGVSSVSIQEVDISNTNVVIDNATNNTTNIINNNNNNTQQIIDSNKVCNQYDKNSIINDNSALTSDGSVVSSSGRGVTDYINIQSAELKLLTKTSSFLGYMCYYNVNKSLISCVATSGLSLGLLSPPENSVYFRGTILFSENKPTFEVCQNGNQSINNVINDDDVSSSSSKATSFFNNFTDNHHGLSSIITTPLNSINLFLSDQCVAPHTIYKGVEISLPCGDILWSREGANNLKDFLNIVYGGLICYYIIINFFGIVNNMKNPEDDRIEVVDL